MKFPHRNEWYARRVGELEGWKCVFGLNFYEDDFGVYRALEADYDDYGEFPVVIIPLENNDEVPMP